ncbi:MAG: hypothetical protein GF375_00960 [Candidatus Omnitrophica bacterium]|nr:hypothetical protein [Candidatus Omnitrophota bacterium]MBD3268707.1 hypothetical protein [Candidatus Omnitrophota bacterium]
MKVKKIDKSIDLNYCPYYIDKKRYGFCSVTDTDRLKIVYGTQRQILCSNCSYYLCLTYKEVVKRKEKFKLQEELFPGRIEGVSKEKEVFRDE